MSDSLEFSPLGNSPFACGWDASLDRGFAPYRAENLLPARVTGVDRGRCHVVTAAGPARIGIPTTTFSDPEFFPCTGDWLVLRPGPRPEPVTLLPRRTTIVRASTSRSSHGQVLAANVDTVLVVVPADSPVDVERVERLLVLAWASGARPVVALTRCDLMLNTEKTRAAVRALAPGTEVVAVSAVTGAGIPALTSLCVGTVALLGLSGVGKSALGNALLGADHLPTGAGRTRSGQVLPTTVGRGLLPLPDGGLLIDTPGLRHVGLYRADKGLRRVFTDVEGPARDCRFADCGHSAEPGCGVRAAIEAGVLDPRRPGALRALAEENALASVRGEERARAARTGRHARTPENGRPVRSTRRR